MKASDYIARFLATQGVTHVYEVIGGMITHMIDSLYQAGEIEIVDVRHEQAAAFAADAMGRCTGVPGVAMATSGPGATNLLTGIGSCYFDSSPSVFLTGQVNRHEQRGDRPIRQLGFQETDIVAMAAPITKAAVRVNSAEELPSAMREAFRLAMADRPGPVLVDVPMDVQGGQVEADGLAPLTAGPLVQPPPGAVDAALDALATAERPLILVGAGVRCGRAIDQLRALVAGQQVPVVNSLLAVDALPYDDPMRVGLIGSYGNRWANMAIGEADCMLVLGSRLDIRQTGADVEAFKGERQIFHVDCDPGELDNRVPGTHAIHADVGAFLEEALAATELGESLDRSRWNEQWSDLRRRWPDTDEIRDVPGINPNEFMHRVSAVSGSAAAYVIDVGQHQQWAAQSLQLLADQRFITSGGMGAMGFALPAAIGTAGSFPGRPIVVIAGDGSFQLNLQELETVAHAALPLKMVVIDNRCHGMVRQFQQSYFDERYQGTLWGYSAPAFTRVAHAFGIESARVEHPDEVDGGLAALWADPGEPFLLQVMVDTMANAYPKLAFGRPMTEMEPFATPVAMEGT